MNVLKGFVRLLLVAGIVALGLLAAKRLVEMKKEPPTAPPVDRRPLVRVTSLATEDVRLEVSGAGTVIAADTWVVRPQVAGRLVSVAASLELGHVVTAGAELLKIDASDYELAVRAAEATHARAKAELSVEAGKRRLAERELALLASELPVDPDDRAIALRSPQLAAGKATIQSAQVSVERAQADLARTTVVSPFDGLVIKESATVGQVVSAQAEVATLVRADVFWVEASFPASSLAEIQAAVGATVRVILGVDPPSERTGTLLRLTGQVDPQGRLFRALVEVKDPLALKTPGALPLPLGAWVRVEVPGRTLPAAIRVPRRLLHGGDRLAVVRDGKLAVQELTVIRREDDAVVVSAGVSPADRVLESRLQTVVPGLAVRVEGEEPAGPAAPQPKADPPASPK